MSDLLILGTDTDAGKTTFALLWMTAFGDEYAYWKPIETGPSDSEKMSVLVPASKVLKPLLRLAEPVAPPLAARQGGAKIPLAREIAAAKPRTDRCLLIESFGGPLSPLNESELQIELVRRLDCPAILVSSSKLGAIGRTLSTLRVLQSEGVCISAIVLIGSRDEYAENEIAKHGRLAVFSLGELASWDPAGLRIQVSKDLHSLQNLRKEIEPTDAGSRLIEVKEWIARDRTSLWHPYTSLRGSADPLPVVSAQDEFIELADGRRLIDGISSWWTILHGHRPPRLMAALREAAGNIDHVMFAGLTHPYAIECAERLMKTAPWPNGRVFYSDNGSTAVEVALKMAYQCWCHRGEPHRRLFVGLEGCYHGDTFGAMAVSRDPVFFGQFEPLLFETARVPLDPERLDSLLALRGSEVAAVIVEPLVQGAGGMRIHSPAELRDLFSVARKHGVLFIVDEVMSSCRTGTFWAHTQAGIAPDLICASKTLAGGVLPLATTLVSPQVVSEFDVADRSHTFFHGHSFTAHPLACAVAAENLKLISEGVWQADSTRITQFWTQSSRRLAQLREVANLRVCGTILAVDVGEGGYLAELGATMRNAAIEKGVLLRPLGNVLYAMPPLCTSDESLSRIVDAFEAAVLAVNR